MRLVVVALLLLSSVTAEAAEEDLTTSRWKERRWRSDHPIAIGSRVSASLGGYAAPGVGGHLKIRPWDWVGVETFSDNFVRLQDDAWRRDHVIGFSLYFPSLISGDGWYIAPTIGTCVDFRVAHPTDPGVPSVSDILFGVHGGAVAEIFVPFGFSVQVAATMYAYYGHDTSYEDWSAEVSSDLSWSPLGQLTAGINWYF